MRLAACVALFLLAPLPAAAIIGGAPAPADIAAQTALIVSTRASCRARCVTGDLLITPPPPARFSPEGGVPVCRVRGGAQKLLPSPARAASAPIPTLRTRSRTRFRAR